MIYCTAVAVGCVYNRKRGGSDILWTFTDGTNIYRTSFYDTFVCVEYVMMRHFLISAKYINCFLNDFNWCNICLTLTRLLITGRRGKNQRDLSDILGEMELYVSNESSWWAFFLFRPKGHKWTLNQFRVINQKPKDSALNTVNQFAPKWHKRTYVFRWI